MDRRLKAMDVFNTGTPLIGGKATFDEAFPEVEDVQVEVAEEGRTGPMSQFRGPAKYSNGYVGEYINCSNPLCYNGGVHIGPALRDMVHKRETVREIRAFCQGYEGSPKGRRRYKDCSNFFHVKIALTYRQPPAE